MRNQAGSSVLLLALVLVLVAALAGCVPAGSGVESPTSAPAAASQPPAEGTVTAVPNSNSGATGTTEPSAAIGDVRVPATTPTQTRVPGTTATVAATPAATPTLIPTLIATVTAVRAAPTMIPTATAVRPAPTPTRQPTPVSGRFAGCSGSGPVTFAQSPMRLDDFAHLLPYGALAGAHVTPIDHMYFSPTDWSLGRDVYEVRAIQDGVIYNLQPRDVNVDTGKAKQREWRMDIAHTCTFVSYFDLLTSLDPALEAEWNKTQGGRTGPWNGIPIKAGQLVGRIGAQTLDFGVYDYTVILPGFVVPSHYDGEVWKVHTVDPFPHFPADVRDALLKKMLRKAEPRAGKIDHDVDAKLVGNWFQKGTNGYAGTNPSKYWDGHLAVVPDSLDPTQWRFSIGNFSGESRQFGIKGNGPDPRIVTAESGPVKYELTYYEWYAVNEPSRRGGSGSLRPGDDIASRNLDQVLGVALVQMTGARTLQCEVFPGKTAAEVQGFTAAAKVFER